jgi:hypothetical protein
MYIEAQKDSGVRGYIVVAVVAAVVVAGTRNNHNQIDTTAHNPHSSPSS